MSESSIGITIVGGGVYAPHLCEALAHAIHVPMVRLSLTARDRARVGVLAAHAGKRLSRIKPRWSVISASSLDAALEDTSLIILLVRVGGLAARAWDEEFPSRHGLVGDEGLGPGGIANSWRTVPELDRIAGRILRVAPDVQVLNLMAPLGITTRLLLDRGLAALGLCELPAATLRCWLAGAGALPGESQYRYGGLNHLGWFVDLVAGGRNLLQALADSPKLALEGFPIDAATLERFRAAPLRYYYEIFDPLARARLGLGRRPGRALELSALAKTLLDRFAAEPGADHPEADRRPTPWLDLAVAPVAAALLGGPPHAGFVNLRNESLFPELPPEQIVEVAATFAASGVQPVRPGPMPPEVIGFLRRICEVESLSYGAALGRDPELLAKAIGALPLPIGRAQVHDLAVLARRSAAPT